MRDRARRLSHHLPPSLRLAVKGAAARVPRRTAEAAPDRVDPRVRDLRGDVLVTADLPAPAGAYVVDADPRNQRATVVADLAEPGSLPAARFDAVVLGDAADEAALANAWQALRPGGVLLAAASADALARACGGATELVPGVPFARAVK